MTSFSSIGDISSLCQMTALPICKAFGNIASLCSMQPVVIFGGSAGDLGELLAAYLCFMGVLTISYRTHTKYAAVGRLEMNFLNILYLFILLTEMGLGIFTGSTHLVTASLNGGLVAGFFWVLLINGIVPFQALEDGNSFNLWSIFISTSAISTATSFLIYGSSKGNLLASPTTNSPILYAIVIFWPIVSVVVYGILSIVLVLSKLSQRKTLINLLFAALFAILSASATVVVNNELCMTSMKFVTGAPFGVVLAFLSFVMVHRYWFSITESSFNSYR